MYVSALSWWWWFANEYGCVAIKLYTLPSISMGSASVDSTNCIPRILGKKNSESSKNKH